MSGHLEHLDAAGTKLGKIPRDLFGQWLFVAAWVAGVKGDQLCQSFFDAIFFLLAVVDLPRP
jgi:hypothetical protein